MISAYQIGAAAQNASGDSPYDIQLKQAAIASAQLAAQIGTAATHMPLRQVSWLAQAISSLLIHSISFVTHRDATNAAAAAR